MDSKSDCPDTSQAPCSLYHWSVRTLASSFPSPNEAPFKKPSCNFKIEIVQHAMLTYYSVSGMLLLPRNYPRKANNGLVTIMLQIIDCGLPRNFQFFKISFSEKQKSVKNGKKRLKVKNVLLKKNKSCGCF